MPTAGQCPRPECPTRPVCSVPMTPVQPWALHKSPDRSESSLGYSIGRVGSEQVEPVGSLGPGNIFTQGFSPGCSNSLSPA